MKYTSFRDLEIWNKVLYLAKDIYDITKNCQVKKIRTLFSNSKGSCVSAIKYSRRLRKRE